MSTLGKRLLGAIKEGKKKGFVPLQASVHVAALRKKLSLSQREFSEAYHINIETLRKWEQRNRVPDSIGLIYLKCIQKDPERMRKLVNG